MHEVTSLNLDILNLFLNIFIKSSLLAFIFRVVLKHVKPQRLHFRKVVSLSAIIVLLILPLFCWITPDVNIASFTIKLDQVSIDSIRVENSEELSPMSLQHERSASAGNILSVRNALALLNLLIYLFLCVSVLLILRLGTQALKMRKEINRLDTIRSPECLRTVEILKDALGYKKDIMLYISNSIKSPGTVGFNNPGIILPRKLYRKLSLREMKCILAHEIHHMKNRDHFTALVQYLCKALYWWNPFVYGINSQLSKAMEGLADEASSIKNGRKTYASSLLSIAGKMKCDTEPAPFFISFAATHEPIKMRIEHILKGEAKMKNAPGKLSKLSLALLVILITAGISAGSISFAEDKKDTAEKKKEIEKLWETAEKPSKENKPKFKVISDLKYPAEARKNGIAGTVTIEALFGKDGTMVDYKVIKSPDKLLTDALVKMLQGVAIDLRKTDGQVKPIRATFTVKYKLD